MNAFYDRVITQVCQAYRENSGLENKELIEVIEQKWRARLECYTGVSIPRTHSEATHNQIVDSLDTVQENESQLQSRESASTSSNAVASNSIFKSMIMNKRAPKRRFSQLDGEIDEIDDILNDMSPSDSSHSIPNGDSEEDETRSNSSSDLELDTNLMKDLQERITESSDQTNVGAEITQENTQETEENHDNISTNISNSRHVQEMQRPTTIELNDVYNTNVDASEFIPISKLSVYRFPCQIAAQYKSFGYKYRKKMYTGNLINIIITGLHQVNINENTSPLRVGNIFWVFNCTSIGHEDHLRKSDICDSGEIVEIKNLIYDETSELPSLNSEVIVQSLSDNKNERNVKVKALYRFQEYSAREGTVQLYRPFSSY